MTDQPTGQLRVLRSKRLSANGARIVNENVLQQEVMGEHGAYWRDIPVVDDGKPDPVPLKVDRDSRLLLKLAVMIVVPAMAWAVAYFTLIT